MDFLLLVKNGSLDVKGGKYSGAKHTTCMPVQNKMNMKQWQDAKITSYGAIWEGKMVVKHLLDEVLQEP